jgi:hypothetical protein
LRNTPEFAISRIAASLQLLAVVLPLLLGVGVAFKIYYIMAWRDGKTGLLQRNWIMTHHVSETYGAQDLYR